MGSLFERTRLHSEIAASALLSTAAPAALDMGPAPLLHNHQG